MCSCICLYPCALSSCSNLMCCSLVYCICIYALDAYHHITSIRCISQVDGFVLQIYMCTRYTISLGISGLDAIWSSAGWIWRSHCGRVMFAICWQGARPCYANLIEVSTVLQQESSYFQLEQLSTLTMVRLGIPAYDKQCQQHSRAVCLSFCSAL